MATVLDELERLDKEATSGPWEDWLDGGERGLACLTLGKTGGEVVFGQDPNTQMADIPNTRLCAVMRNALPSLLAAARAGQAYREAMERVLNKMDFKHSFLDAETIAAWNETGIALSTALAPLLKEVGR